MIVTPYAERINALSIPTSFARRQVAMHMKTPFTPAISLAFLSGLEALNFEQTGQHSKNTFLASISELEKESGSPSKTIKTILGHFQHHGSLEVLSYIPVYAKEEGKRFYHLLDPPLDRPLTPAEEFKASKFEEEDLSNYTKEIRSALDRGDSFEVYRLNGYDYQLFEKAIHGQIWEYEARDTVHLATTEIEGDDDHAGTMLPTMSNSSPLPTN